MFFDRLRVVVRSLRFRLLLWNAGAVMVTGLVILLAVRQGVRYTLLFDLDQVLRDRSRVVWRGMIRVEPEAQKTDGYQRCDALLLSPTCRNDAIPGLEIEADDVRCTHGATAGRVDEEQVFYCMCRGMTEFEAMHIIVEGFFRTVYDRIPVEAVRETLDIEPLSR